MRDCSVVNANLNSAPLIEVVFRNNERELADPLVVTFTWADPSGTLTVWTYGVDAEVFRLSEGVYYVNLPLPETGRYPWEWTGSGDGGNGAVDASDSGVLCAKASVFV